MDAGTDLSARILKNQDRLGPAEKRVAEAVLADPTTVFGGVAEVAQSAGTSEPTVVRLAVKLGFKGFAQMRASVREALPNLTRPAHERLEDLDGADPVARALAIEVENVRRSLGGTDPTVLRRAASNLSDSRRNVWIISSEATLGVASRVYTELQVLREGIHLLVGNDAAVARWLGLIEKRDIILAFDIRRYDRWALDATRAAQAKGGRVIAVTDGLLSPYAELAEETFVVATEAPGPFLSQVGTLAVANLIVTAVAGELKATAVARLRAIERSVAARGALVE